MSDVTRLLDAAAAGDANASANLLPRVYAELRELAAARMAAEPTGQTLTATALVHEAYVRLVDVKEPQNWNGRGHFFAAAAEAMRRILVDRARAKAADKRGGQFAKLNIDDVALVTAVTPDQLLAIDEALARLEARDAAAGQLVKLRYFAGLSVEEAGQALDISTATAYRHWKFARAWLYSELQGDRDSP
jgi:RNA polymerase sigma factor (TIGR02999 family)